jgi:hypothetical protein
MSLEPVLRIRIQIQWGSWIRIRNPDPYPDLGGQNVKLYFFKFLVIKTLDPDPEPDLDSLEMLDPDPDLTNPGPQHCLELS